MTPPDTEEQLRQPRLAELVAAQLRTRILAGEFTNGGQLPRQEDLLAEFRVSKPSIREALRILETEGLITVRRGNVGGASVHPPQAATAAHTLAMVLESKQVHLSDVGTALQHIEPRCASLCAARADRETEVLPHLRDVQRRAYDALDDRLTLSRLALEFHELLVACCGSETLITLVGALESLWARSQQAWTAESVDQGQVLDPKIARTSLATHDELIELIEAGDVDGTARAAHAHLQGSHFFAHVDEAQEIVDAGTLASDLRDR